MTTSHRCCCLNVKEKGYMVDSEMKTKNKTYSQCLQLYTIMGVAIKTLEVHCH